MRHVVVCIGAFAAVVMTAMCCVSGWHRLMNPAERPARLPACDAAIPVLQQYRDKYWLSSGTSVSGSEKIWGAVAWNRGNLVLLLKVARNVGDELLPPDYWESLRRATNSSFRSRVQNTQASILRFESKHLPRASEYWCFIPLWLAWMAVSVYPMFVVVKGVALRRWRGKRGQCRRCGYLLRGNLSGVCPECGRLTGEHELPPASGSRV